MMLNSSVPAAYFRVKRSAGRLFLVGASLLLVSCGGPSKDEEEDMVESTDTVKASVLNVAGELFSVPSPIQTALLIQKSGLAYNKAMLNESHRVNTYSTEFLRTLNLGVYGADLAYVSLYNQTQDALGYLSAVKQLSDKLGISNAFDEVTMNRIKNNITNKDSMMVLVGLAYRGSDAYLKNNQRSDVSSLILAGGWIESMYFSTSSFKNKASKELRYRISEQKQALTSLVRILGMQTSDDVKALTASLTELQKVYENIEFKYTFVEPEHDTLRKLTYINSTTEVIVNDDTMNRIVSLVEEIRSKIVSQGKS
ncbi:MAG TPA: hypothetical protein PLQ93_11885 [Bacteroidia bacterium]|nr:hypothetical protein [Bacteroidia bacterium]